MEKQIARQIAHLTSDKDVEELIHGRWSHMEALDEDEWLEHLEEHLKEIVNISGKDEETLAKRLEEHRQEVHDRIAQEHPELAERFRERRHLLDEHLRERRPECLCSIGRSMNIFGRIIIGRHLVLITHIRNSVKQKGLRRNRWMHIVKNRILTDFWDLFIMILRMQS